MIKIDKKYERNKFDNSNENLYYINNRNASEVNNSSYYNKSSSSISLIKEAQNNNNVLRKNTSNLHFINIIINYINCLLQSYNYWLFK